MTQDLIRYDVLVQEALRGVVRKVMGEVAKTGLPGDHHFYVSFDTRHPGVRLSGRLRQRYPTEMTVVLQHQYWDFEVTENWFEVNLSFSGVPERLHVPFNAVKGFVDPSVEFGLQFEVISEGEGEAEPEGPKLVPIEPSTIPTPPVEIARAEPAEEVAKTPEATPPESEPAAEPAATATVVSLDKFRKK
ncbi:MAG: ClpXP protease specificity-enhancing factor SspB [Hyphomicrobiales bacterium]|nr:ClpXP protease specificity-enhancing factor SspB [Hyphomicrobiales bacterium]